MGHNNDWTILYKGTGISIGEIKTVLDFDSDDLGTLCGGKYPTTDAYPDINIWAKYKPFRSNDIGIISPSVWLTAMQAAGFGFGDTKETLKYNCSQASPEWKQKYLRPRGRSYGELFRQLDFVDLTASSQYGYDRNAVPPLKITYDGGGTVLHGSNSGVRLEFNASANASWNGNTCVSFNDLLPTTLTDYRFAVRLSYQPPYAGTEITTVIISSAGPADVPSSGGHIDIPFAGVESNDHIFVPMIAENNGWVPDGANITVKVGLIDDHGWRPELSPDSYGYVFIYGAGTDPYYFTGNFVSLNFQNGMDSKTLTYAKANSIVGLTGSISATVTSGGGGYNIDNITISLDKTGCISWGDRTTVYAQLFICAYPNSYGSPLLFYGTGPYDTAPLELAGVPYTHDVFPEEEQDQSTGMYAMTRVLNSDTRGADYVKFVAVTGSASSSTWATTVLNRTGSTPDKTLKRSHIDLNSESGIYSGRKAIICGYVYSGSLVERGPHSNPETDQGTIIKLNEAVIDLD